MCAVGQRGIALRKWGSAVLRDFPFAELAWKGARGAVQIREFGGWAGRGVDCSAQCVAGGRHDTLLEALDGGGWVVMESSMDSLQPTQPLTSLVVMSLDVRPTVAARARI